MGAETLNRSFANGIVEQLIGGSCKDARRLNVIKPGKGADGFVQLKGLEDHEDVYTR